MIEQIGDLLSSGGADSAAGGVLIALCGLFAVCAVRLSVIDLREHRLPNRIIYPWTAATLALLAAAAVLTGDAVALLRAIMGAVLWSAGFLSVRLIHSPALGMGDVKLAAVLGLHAGLPGWSTLILAVTATFLIGGLVALVLLAAGRAGRGSRIPFGPFMLGGTGLALLLG
ncbi:prepilin peptidase [Nesterenkonia populi]|uniref:prepilin peptidase n=1 Tax=Nesterenkonia populi TaxID=1591087 RepID=UPI001FE2C7A6|nr:A24 family peptidase [Nesterenkonia populi]